MLAANCLRHLCIPFDIHYWENGTSGVLGTLSAFNPNPESRYLVAQNRIFVEIKMGWIAESS
jgi:hypothetical protein